MFIKQFYDYLMNKYNWTTTQIDDEDFWFLYDLAYGDWKEEIADEPVMTIDQVRAMYR